MRYLHTMIRVSDLEESLNFFKLLDIHEVSRKENEQARFTLVFLSASADEKLVENAKSPLIELTFNWDEKDYDEILDILRLKLMIFTQFVRDFYRTR